MFSMILLMPAVLLTSPQEAGLRSTQVSIEALGGEDESGELSSALRAALEGSSLEVFQNLELGRDAETQTWVAEQTARGFRAVIDAESVGIEFLGEGATGASLGVELALDGWGRASHWIRVSPARVDAVRDSIALHRDGIVEWYRNGANGLEQGFTVLANPAPDLEGCGLELRMRVAGELEAEVQGADSLVWRDACGRALLAYAGLRAWDSNGRDLDARLLAVGEWLSILVDDADARYPLTIDPLITSLETKLLPPSGDAVSIIGYRVEIDGDTAIAAGIQNNLASRARVYVFVRDPSGWSRQAMVSPPGTAYELGGIALFKDRFAIAKNPDGAINGSHHIFARTGTTWSQQGAGSNGSCCALYGLGLALTSDRFAYTNDEGGPNNTKIQRFTGTSWVTEANMPPGGHVALRDDLFAINTNPAPYWNFPQIRIYQRTGTTWNLLATPMSPPYGRYPVALDEEHTLAIGAPNDSQAGNNAGAVFLMRRDGANWVLWKKILSPNFPSSAGFGLSLALEGGTLAVGSPSDNTAGSNAGAVYLYRRNGGWNLVQQLLAPDAAVYDLFGWHVALEGERVLVGAPNDVDLGAATGSAYMFTMQHDAEVYCTAKVNSLGCLPEIDFTGQPSASSATPFTISARNVVNQHIGVCFYGTSGRSNASFQDGFRCVALPTLRTGTLFSGGNLGASDCSGVLALDFNSHIQSGLDPALVAGAVVTGQFWYRDGLASFGTGLSDAIEFEITP